MTYGATSNAPPIDGCPVRSSRNEPRTRPTVHSVSSSSPPSKLTGVAPAVRAVVVTVKAPRSKPSGWRPGSQVTVTSSSNAMSASGGVASTGIVILLYPLHSPQ